MNETNLSLRNAFISNIFALGGEKESKYDKRTPFWGPLQKLDLSVNPYPLKDAYKRFSGIL